MQHVIAPLCELRTELPHGFAVESSAQWQVEDADTVGREPVAPLPFGANDGDFDTRIFEADERRRGRPVRVLGDAECLDRRHELPSPPRSLPEPPEYRFVE